MRPLPGPLYVCVYMYTALVSQFIQREIKFPCPFILIGTVLSHLAPTDGVGSRRSSKIAILVL